MFARNSSVIKNSDKSEIKADFTVALAGNPKNTQDVATIQSLSAYSEGWGKGVISSRNYPPIEEVNGVLKTISYQTCYLLQEGIPEYDSNTEYSNTSIVKSISGTRLNCYVSLQNNNIGHPLSDTTYWAQATLNTGRNVGEIITSTIPLNDSGVHLLDGSVLSGSGIYSDFVSYISNIYSSALNYFCTETEWQTSVNNYGVCGKFVYNSTNNTVRLPKITGFIEGTIDTNTLGNLTPAGIPNLLGWFSGSGERGTHCDGILFRKRGNLVPVKNVDGDKDNTYTFNAQAYNPIYGNSDTVQPQSIKVLYYIVVANTQKTEIQVDIDNIATDLNGKANVSLSNVNSTGSSTGASWAMPSDRYIDLTLGASLSTYTAPANGYVLFAKRADNSSDWFAIYKDNVKWYQSASAGGNTQVLGAYIPILKGQTFSIEYNLGSETEVFRFYYAVGSESEA